MRIDDLKFDAAADAPVKACLRQVHYLPHVKKVFLYGSYAKGTNRHDSDIDLAVFYDLSETEMLFCYRQLAGVCRIPEADIQAQAFPISELSDPCGIIAEILMYGVEIVL